MGKRMMSGGMATGSMVMKPGSVMRGGGLARKGVGQALRGGGLARKGVGQALKCGGRVKRGK